MKSDKNYLEFIGTLKQEIISSRYQAARLANREQLSLYYKTGGMLSEKVKAQKWGTKVLEQIAIDLQKNLPGLKGFSFTNLKKMRQFFEAYPNFEIRPSLTAQMAISDFKQKNDNSHPIGPLPTVQLDVFWSISFTHHILLLNRCKKIEERWFYIENAATQFWPITVMEHQIDADLFRKEGRLPNNFQTTIKESLKPSALKVFKDEYLLDFIAGDELDDERQIEQQVVLNIRNFILKMGKGFCFIGNQYRLEVEGDEFFIDLLFFNRHLQALVAFELKKTKFKPADAGQLNFYLNVLDDQVKLPHENSSIGIVLCKEKNNTVVEFAIKSFDKAMGVATYKTSKQTPVQMKGILPDTDELGKLLE
ncbi:PDDEXK nuclease domain-containing protein [Ferruginibacter paludis]|uniref:PDDEXK nuclease domain-containing protein n=1 Tax=Ferruginibacter paludis TaxID=1310417 RepID=UPI0025B626A4|nr:PDDEXK nuclease domain-containing protein [Ferruginibacter paludis]MDN3653985.1 PDDEXK nuclease domain-containing protein [Ferruginibacter paludis]